MQIIKEEMIDLKERFGDDRRTELIDIEGDLSIEDLIADEDMVITISHQGYIKRIPVDTYRQQHRGGRGVTGMRTKEEDFVEHLFIASTHSYILFLTDRGHCHWLKVHEIPEGGRVSRGRPVVNLIEIDEGHKVAAIVPVKAFEDGRYLMKVTRNGLVKKTVLPAYSRPRRGGIIAMNIMDDDRLIGAEVTSGSQEIVLATRNGQAIRFHEQDVRDMGRGTRGVRGISLDEGDEVVCMVVVQDAESTLLTVSAKGYGKRTGVSDYRLTRRGGKGVINIRTSERNGRVVAVRGVVDEDELMIVTLNGILIRQAIGEISSIGRNTQGVRLINLDDDDEVMDVARVVSQNNGDGSEGLPPDTGPNGDTK
jgi:DNA gyrase subunit A